MPSDVRMGPGSTFGFVIYDMEDSDFFMGEVAGDECWSTDIRKAAIYADRRSAQAALEDCDEAEILRDRLVVREVVRG